MGTADEEDEEEDEEDEKSMTISSPPGVFHPLRQL